MGLLNSSSLLLVAGSVAAILLVRLATAWVKHRRFYKGLPKPPHSFWTGNIVSFMSAQRALPPNTHPHVVMMELARQHALGPLFYVDLWPVAPPIMMVHDAGAGAELIQERQLERHPYALRLSTEMIGPYSLSRATGAQWRQLRKMLAPGFAPAQMRAMTREVAGAVEVLRERLASLADAGAVFAMQEVGGDVTADVIGAVVLGRSFDCQRRFHPMVHYFRKCVGAHKSSLNALAESLDWFGKKWYTWRLNREIMRAIEERYEHGGGEDRDGGTVAVVDLALEVYRQDNLAANKGHAKLDGQFKVLALDSVKNLLIGGHDNNAIALAYTIHLIATHPDVLAQVRQEHDTVFDPDAEKTLEFLLEDPKRLKQLPLTSACIKETLRLYPPGAFPRMAPHGSYYKHTDGISYPLWDHMLWVSAFGIQRQGDIWPNPSKFDPTRFLPSSHVPKDGWRPFEKGPRTCLGMELTMMELEVILLLVLREFDFETVYGPKAPVGREEYGGVVCQVGQFAPRPPEGLPMRVKRRVK